VVGWLAAVTSPDPRVRIVLATRLVSVAAAPVTLLLVLTRLVPAEQGLYFIFVNVLALSQLFETGAGSLVVQYASHEFSYVRWGVRGSFDAPESTLLRLRWILGRLLRWYGFAATVLVVVGVPLGLGLFTSDVKRQVGSTTFVWLTTVFATAAYLPLVPILNTIEGGGRLIEVQRMRLAQALGLAVSSWILIPTVGGLFAVATNAVLQFVLAISWLLRRYPQTLAFAWRAASSPPVYTVSSSSELHRLYQTQLRTAAIWISAHVAAQGLSPLILFYHGSANAGRVGATLAITTVPYTIAMSWLQGRLPDFGALAARGSHTELDATAKKATAQAVVVCLAGIIAVLCAIAAVDLLMPALRDRILGLLPATALAAAALISLLLQAMAAYIRAYRTEPLVRVLVVGYAAMLGAAWIAASRFGPSATVFAYFLGSVVVALPATALTLRHERKKLTQSGDGA
jgi:hypothetical protein